MSSSLRMKVGSSSCTHTDSVMMFTGHVESEGAPHVIATQALPLSRETFQQARTRYDLTHTPYTGCSARGATSLWQSSDHVPQSPGDLERRDV